MLCSLRCVRLGVCREIVAPSFLRCALILRGNRRKSVGDG
jgi:hypothetical protein